MKLLIMQFSPISRYFISLRTKYSPQHPVSNTLSLCSSLNATDQSLLPIIHLIYIPYTFQPSTLQEVLLTTEPLKMPPNN
jgi:hypothetical protein